MRYYGIDPDRMRELGDESKKISSNLHDRAGEMRSRVRDLWLQEIAGSADAIFVELTEELSYLADFAAQKATDIEDAANGRQTTPDDDALARLEGSLNDGIGSTGLDDRESQIFLDAVNQWIADHPQCSADELREKMREAVAANNQQAVDALSKALWARLKLMGSDKSQIDKFLADLGDETVIIAVESVGAPPADLGTNAAALAAVTDLLTRYAAAPPGLPKIPASELSVYLMQRFGVDLQRANYGDTAAAHLDNISTWSELAAKCVTDSILLGPARRSDKPGPSFGGPRIGGVLRRVLNAHQQLLRGYLDNAVVAERLGRIAAYGATNQELNDMQIKFAGWVAQNGGGTADVRAFGELYVALAKAGHRFVGDWDKLLAVVGPWADLALKGLPFGSNLADILTGLMEPSGARKKKHAVMEQRNAALVILMLTDPKSAQTLLSALKIANVPPGDLSQERWDELMTAAANSQSGGDGPTADEINAAKNALGDLVLMLEGAWQH